MELSGDIHRIGLRVINEVCAQAGAWLDAGTPRRIAVNVSPLQLATPTLVSEFFDALDTHDVPPDLIQVEITEGAAITDLPRIDILINNAGICPSTATEDLDDTDLEAMLAGNIRAPHVLVSQIAPAMAGLGGGCIVNVGSWMARVGNPIAALCSATKAAEEQLTRSWAAEFGPRGVRVNTIAPGATLTPGNEAARPILDSMTPRTPAGVVIRPSDIASGVLFLVSDDATMIHGVILDVDGGISATRPV